MPSRTGILLALCSLLLPLVPTSGWAQGLPEFAPLNPMASSRSGLYYQPYREPAPGRWISAFGLEYASVIEYNRLPQADYVLDSELLRLSVGLSRDLGQHTFRYARRLTREYNHYLLAAELPKELRFYDLRHAGASLLLADGVPMTGSRPCSGTRWPRPRSIPTPMFCRVRIGSPLRRGSGYWGEPAVHP